MDETVNAGDIARLVNVGRAAVSNWRKRYDDFPQPVGGTASSPLFSLADVEKWLRRNGKSFHVSPAERLWQRLSGDDLKLGERVAETDTDRETFEFLYQRYAEAHSRQLNVTPDDIAELMVHLANAKKGTVADPACGTGSLLMKAGGRKLGQELDPTSAKIARRRLPEAEIHTGDSLRHNQIETADAVVCDPPFHERSWGHEELVGDARWTYGQPPRGEPELAWAQHCLSLVKPGGKVAILMPGAAASRRPGKRIRANLLRAGAIEAVITVAGGRDIWVLKKPEANATPPQSVLLLEEYADEQPNTRIIDLLDEDVDISPARRRDADVGRAFLEARQRFELPAPPQLDERETPPMTTIGELVRRAPGTTPVTSPTGTVYEIDPDRLDPDFLDGLLRAALASTPTGSSRLDLRRTQAPSLPFAEQQRYGKAFRQLRAMEEALGQGAEVVRLGFLGLLGGRIGP
ncbi:SAM-dependent methyltransferase [Lentzea sp. NBRC 105346]|uniref:N-6 DNA methylase n=1 Tax=Lentzea sp. NBRC 105346 TaxID=3032205 RepID=UPI0024A42539|nr:N-6 DNA methylase [Lentzea sp. NBRC 105346]GLZ30004.1 SAM-dependent methyltransferase [Lentzea sp. NBRC 105346]